MFHRLAPYYDAQYAQKDYRLEARRLEAIARRFGRSGGSSWLDVGCGTGRHLEQLRGRHAIVGVDLSADMLRIARRRLPGVRLVQGDMRSFRLGQQFDVVTSLFSAVGHLRSEAELRASFENFARHLKPGGVVIVEPWLDPTNVRPGTLHLLTQRAPGSVIVRLASSAVRGRHTHIHYHFLIGRTGHGVEYLDQVDVGLLVPRSRYLVIMRRAGLDARFLARGLPTGRGLYVGRKPGRAPSDPRWRRSKGEPARTRTRHGPTPKG